MTYALALIVLVVAGLVYWLLTWWSIEAFFRHNEPTTSGGYLPPVSILKPVKGLEPEAYDNLSSFCRQKYPQYELLFGVSDPLDPAIDVFRRLQHDYPDCPIRWRVVSGGGQNPKTRILAELTPQAQYSLLAISDSDIRVGPDYLRSVVAPMADADVGLVTCLYRCQASRRLPARWEALYLETDFLSAVVLAHRWFGVRLGLGATLVVRSADLKRTGGWATMADYLADDYQLATRIGRLGFKVHVARYVVTNVLDGTSFGAQRDREFRWARGIRTSCPFCYLGRILTASLPVTFVLLALASPTPPVLALLGATAVARGVVAWRMRAGLGQTRHAMDLVWLPLRDLVTMAVWCAGVVGRRVRWRGQTYRLTSDGRLRVVPRTSGRSIADRPAMALASRRLGIQADAGLGEVAKAAVRQLDAWLRRRYGIRDYSSHPDCLFRIALASSDDNFRLPDGTPIVRGDRLGELHFWNEHLPGIPLQGFDLHWAAQMRRRLTLSLAELVEAIRADPRLQEVKAWRAVIALRAPEQSRVSDRLLRRLGFTQSDQPWPRGWFAQLHDLGDDVLQWLLTWTYNPGGLRNRSLVRLRQVYWVSQAELRKRYETAGWSSNEVVRGIPERSVDGRRES